MGSSAAHSAEHWMLQITLVTGCLFARPLCRSKASATAVMAFNKCTFALSVARDHSVRPIQTNAILRVDVCSVRWQRSSPLTTPVSWVAVCTAQDFATQCVALLLCGQQDQKTNMRWLLSTWDGCMATPGMAKRFRRRLFISKHWFQNQAPCKLKPTWRWQTPRNYNLGLLALSSQWNSNSRSPLLTADTFRKQRAVLWMQ